MSHCCWSFSSDIMAAKGLIVSDIMAVKGLIVRDIMAVKGLIVRDKGIRLSIYRPQHLKQT